MPEYVKNRLICSNILNPKTQYAPHFWTVPAYGKILQMELYPDESDLIDKKGTNIIQSIVVTMSYYYRSVYPEIFQAINEISQFQSRPTKDTK